jgi:hypothetical protein
MQFRLAATVVLATSSLFLASPVFAQSEIAGLTVSGSPLPDQPYTLIFPSEMSQSGEIGGAVTINHANMPLQCVLTVVPVEPMPWDAQTELAELDDAEIIGAWSNTFPGFALTTKGTTSYQSGLALSYAGTSEDSPQGAPLTIHHTESVDGANGYVLDCFYATESTEAARPVVDFIIANFSTKFDAKPISAAPQQP